MAITKQTVVNVLEPGVVHLSRVVLGKHLKYILYQLHDANPTCTLLDLHLYIDIPQAKVVQVFRQLERDGWAYEDGFKVCIRKEAVLSVVKPNPKDDPDRIRCKDMADVIAPALRAAYRLQDYNVYATAATLYKIHKDLQVNIDVLDRATRWIALHVSDPYFPILQQPFLLYNKWGAIVNFKKSYDQKQKVAGKAYI